MNTEVLKMLRQRKVLIGVLVALVVVLIWLVAVFVPEGHKLAAVDQKTTLAQTQQLALQDRLAKLKAYSKQSGEFEALSQRLTAAVPATTDVYDYITAISDAAAAAGVQVTSVNPAAGVAATGVAVVPVTVSVMGTYDQTLAFIKTVYSLPRLTVITQISITGGGASSSRSTALTSQFSMDILAQPAALAGQTPAGG